MIWIIFTCQLRGLKDVCIVVEYTLAIPVEGQKGVKWYVVQCEVI